MSRRTERLDDKVSCYCFALWCRRYGTTIYGTWCYVKLYVRGDKLAKLAMTELFETNDIIEIIKFKEVYETLEGAHDRCVATADVIEDIALKYG
ncbi:MAG: hypothetical protein M3530_04430 [Thermoproteota archaeon]|nr:hypothetical protein [Thermoproteota archaeon]